MRVRYRLAALTSASVFFMAILTVSLRGDTEMSGAACLATTDCDDEMAYSIGSGCQIVKCTGGANNFKMCQKVSTGGPCNQGGSGAQQNCGNDCVGWDCGNAGPNGCDFSTCDTSGPGVDVVTEPFVITPTCT